MTAPRVVPPEGPAENLRNALALLGAIRTVQSPVHQRDLVEAASKRIWAALQQIEGK